VCVWKGAGSASASVGRQGVDRVEGWRGWGLTGLLPSSAWRADELRKVAGDCSQYLRYSGSPTSHISWFCVRQEEG
jgi:hypothetical protein